MMVLDKDIKIFADGADINSIKSLVKNPIINGFTTNPTLMRSAGVIDYAEFASEVIKLVSPMPVSFEVFADEFDEMLVQSKKIASWGSNVFVKIPVTNSRGDLSTDLIKKLNSENIKLNITAIFTVEQARLVIDSISSEVPSVISVFAGRIADTGIDPMPIMHEIKQLMKNRSYLELLWASPREILNIVQAKQCGCDIITVPPAILSKLGSLGKDHNEFSLETVKMFYDDAVKSGYRIG